MDHYLRHSSTLVHQRGATLPCNVGSRVWEGNPVTAPAQPAWRDYLHTDPAILNGKPVVKGTRLSAEFILSLFAVGWTSEQVLDSYPTLTADALRAVFAFAAEIVALDIRPIPVRRLRDYGR